MKPTKLDILIMAVVLLFAAAISLWANFYLPRGSEVEVYLNNQLYRTVSLNVEQKLTIPGKQGELVLNVNNGQAAIIKADCPLQICKHLGAIKKSGEALVCIPNGVLIKINGKGDNLIDAITQ